MNPRNFSEAPKYCSATSRIRISTREVARPNVGQANKPRRGVMFSPRTNILFGESYRIQKFRIFGLAYAQTLDITKVQITNNQTLIWH